MSSRRGCTALIYTKNYFFIITHLFSTVYQPKAIEICEVKLNDLKFTKVVLNAGKLHGVVDGEYDVYQPDVSDDEVIGGSWIDKIEVKREDVDMLKSRGAALYKRDGSLRIVRNK